MSRRTLVRPLLAAVLLALAAGTAGAHITPPVVLLSDRDALLGLLQGARKFFVREVRLSDAERAAIRRTSGWSPDEDFYRFYLGRDADGRLVAAAVFVTDFTIHGPVRVAVALGPDGRVRGATVVEVTEETYPWVKPLIDQQLLRDFVGQDAHGRFMVSDRIARAAPEAMPQFYAQVVAGLVQRAALLWEVAGVKRGEAA